MRAGRGASFVVDLPAEGGPKDAPTPNLRTELHEDRDPAAGHHAVVAQAVRRILRAGSLDDITGVLLETVAALGGETRTTGFDRPDALPLDLSLGRGPAIVAVAPRGSAARELLEAHLPLLVEDARTATQQWDGRDGTREVRPSAVESRTVLRDLLDRLEEGDALLEVRLETSATAPWSQVGAAASVTRANVRAFDRVFLLEPSSFVVVLPRANAATLATVTTRVEAAIAAHLPQQRLRTGVALVGPDGGVAAYRELRARVDA